MYVVLSPTTCLVYGVSLCRLRACFGRLGRQLLPLPPGARRDARVPLESTRRYLIGVICMESLNSRVFFRNGQVYWRGVWYV